MYRVEGVQLKEGDIDRQHVRHILKQYLNIRYLFPNNVPDRPLDMINTVDMDIA